MTEIAPYTLLADGYDSVMEHVDYDAWVDYIRVVFERIRTEPESILELGCGTGSFAVRYVARRPIRYLATDRSENMLRMARNKSAGFESGLEFARADFTNFSLDERFDAVLLLYDGLNYVLDLSAIGAVVRSVAGVLKAGGLFVFDQSTPVNSLSNEGDFEDEGCCDAFSFTRRSDYHAGRRIHSNKFFLHTGRGVFVEKHVQRVYEYAEIRFLLEDSPFDVIEAYDGFSLQPATDDSERIHWVVRKSQETSP
ncbi:MAG: methyltransferase domain-containing protein [Bacteroidetes bacterium]|nr:methyltransferase domain-containing protein [Bacteroidota bacterium]